MTFQEYKQSIATFIDVLNNSLARVLLIQEQQDKKMTIFLHCFMLMFYQKLKESLDNKPALMEQIYNELNNNITINNEILRNDLEIINPPSYLANDDKLKKTIHLSWQVAVKAHKLQIEYNNFIFSIQDISDIILYVFILSIFFLGITTIALLAAGINTHLFTLCGIILLSIASILATLFVVSVILSYVAGIYNNYKKESLDELYCNDFNNIDKIKTMISNDEIVNQEDMERLFPYFNDEKYQPSRTKYFELQSKFFALPEEHTITTDDFQSSSNAF